METARQQYGKELKKSTQNQLERQIKETTDTVVNREYGDYTIRDHQLKKEQDDNYEQKEEIEQKLKNYYASIKKAL